MNASTLNENYVPVISKGKVLNKFIKKKGQWLLANVEQDIGWPKKKRLIIYQGREVLLLPATKKLLPAVAVLCRDNELDNGKTFLKNFLSALTWYQPGKIHIAQWTNSSIQGDISSKDLRLSRDYNNKVRYTALFFKPSYLPIPQDDKAKLALALFQEGLSLNHKAYAFLSLYKIINLKFPSGGNEQKDWIRNNLSLLEEKAYLKDALDAIRKEDADIAHYIYASCRCAVAHAGVDPVYDPNNLEDERKFFNAWPIIFELAKIIIENEFGIKTRQTIHREHLYELEGFKKIINEQVLSDLKAGKSIPESEFKIKGKFSIRLWNRKKLSAFENLVPQVIQINQGVVLLTLSRNNFVKINISLDFPKEKLIFNLNEGQVFIVIDDETKRAALDIADMYRFWGEIIVNGAIEIYESETNLLLGRLLEYIPVNIIPSETRKNCLQLEKQWRDEAKKRIATKNNKQNKKLIIPF